MTGVAAARLRRRLEPLATIDPAGADLIAAAIADPAETVAAVVIDTDTHPAWAVVIDPAAAPAGWLPWLAQLNGTILLPAGDEAERRYRIADVAHQRRGRTVTMIAAIQLTLTGTKTVRVLERVGGDQWQQTIVTRPSETPDAGATAAAARSQKPLGVIQTYVQSELPLIDEGTLVMDDVAVAIDTATLDDVT